MEETIICPVCGATNPADAALCQNCQWPLRTPQGSTPGGAATGQGDIPAAPDESAAPAIPDWLRDLGRDPQPVPAPDLDSPDRLHAIGNPPLDQLTSAASTPDLLAEERAADVPDWMARIAGTAPDLAETGSDSIAPAEGTGSAQPGTAVGDAAGLQNSGPASGDLPPNDDGAIGGDEIYEWLRRLDASGPGGEQAAPTEQPAGVGTSTPVAVIPDWLGDQITAGGDSAGAASNDKDEPLAAAPVPTPETPPSHEHEDVPGSAAIEPPLPNLTTADPDRASEPPASLDVDAVVASLQTPDWLLDVIPPTSVPEDQAPPAGREDELIAPAELPAWVEAMRPVESIMQPVPADVPDRPPEERGPLLGLQGVLTAIPGSGKPSSKPSVRAMRLEVTEQQRSRAGLLERIVAEETKPVPLKADLLMGSQRTLRWAISAILLVVLGSALIANASVFPLPSGVPNETLSAIRAVENVPVDGRVLVVFDYEPATVGEMEASAASLMDHLLLLRHPVLAVISTSPTGSILADRFMSGAVAARAYESGTGYVNLGYLPGGLAGVRAFADDPRGAVPLDAQARPAWDSPALQSVNALADFNAILVLTDGLESGRVWIEQTSNKRGDAALIVVSSAQAGPMLLPYAASGQISGLVAGLNGAAGTEMANGGLPGYVRKYWDAYSLGMYLAAILIALGGGWYAVSRLRARGMGQGT